MEKVDNTEIIPEPEWEYLLGKLIRYKGVALIMGETDSGKSTIARYLIKRLVSKGITVSLVDSDIGQSSLGLPGTISMKVFRDERDYKTFRFERMLFLGTANPAMVIPMMIKTSGEDGRSLQKDFRDHSCGYDRPCIRKTWEDTKDRQDGANKALIILSPPAGGKSLSISSSRQAKLISTGSGERQM